MKALVLGGGVVGLAAAYYLARDGHEVAVVERNAGVGLETSYANGGQLSYSYVAPLAGPGVLPKVPPWLLRRDAPLRFRPALGCGRVVADIIAGKAPEAPLDGMQLGGV
jgi:D-amino-acid dehydrogenase